MEGSRATRGHGLLEGFLARLRSKQANQLIPAHCRQGRILDIGCGTYPLFLAGTDFAEKYGLDRVGVDGVVAADPNGAVLMNHDMEIAPHLPFPSNHFEVVTLLAVVEHLDPPVLSKTLADVYRVLIPGGACIITTPAAWTPRLLQMLSTLHLVSRDEIDEHKGALSHREITGYLEAAGFPLDHIRLGYFEAGMNIWATASKPRDSGSIRPGG